MEITAEEIQKNYDLHIKIIDHYIQDEDRKKAIKDMIEKLGENYALSPASSKSWFHGAYPGGYLVHVNNVVKIALQQLKLYQNLGGKVDFTEEELVFAALFHDLGKLGDGEKENYLPQDNEYRRNSMQEVYKINGDLDFMLIPDRSLFLLQKFGIKTSQKEYLAIKLHDGLFEESNKPYYISFNPNSVLKSNIVYIIHVADLLASKLEKDLESC